MLQPRSGPVLGSSEVCQHFSLADNVRPVAHVVLRSGHRQSLQQCFVHYERDPAWSTGTAVPCRRLKLDAACASVAHVFHTIHGEL